MIKGFLVKVDKTAYFENRLHVIWVLKTGVYAKSYRFIKNRTNEKILN